MRTLESRFWSKVDKQGPTQPGMTTSCWQWTASLREGYGRIKIGRSLYSAHRVAWELHHGKLIPERVLICHRCDNRACVRHDHLFIGSEQDNAMDMVRKERHGNLKLSAQLVRQIGALDIRKVCDHKRVGSITQVEAAKVLGVTQSTISLVVNRKRRAHVIEEVERNESSD